MPPKTSKSSEATAAGASEARDGVRALTGAHFRVFVGSKEIDASAVVPLIATTEGEAPQVAISRAVSEGSDLLAWQEGSSADKDDRRDVTVFLLDGPDGAAKVGWRFVGCRPLRWTPPALDALRSAVALETLEVSYDRVTRVDPRESRRTPRP